MNDFFTFYILGGRNTTVSLQSRAGQNHMPTIVGLFVFSQFWYWFPLSHFLSLSFTPTCIIGLNSNLKVSVDFNYLCFLSHFWPTIYHIRITWKSIDLQYKLVDWFLCIWRIGYKRVIGKEQR